jgi:hypothetical protein
MMLTMENRFHAMSHVTSTENGSITSEELTYLDVEVDRWMTTLFLTKVMVLIPC